MAQVPNPEAAAPAAPPPAPPAKGKSPMVAMIVTALVVFPIAVGAVKFMSKPNAAATKAKEVTAEEEEEKTTGETVTFPLTTQTVNLAEGDRYVRVKLEMAFDLEPDDAEHFRTKVAAMSAEGKEKSGEGGHGEGEGKKKKKKEPGPKVTRLLHLLTNRSAQLNDALIHELSGRRYEDMLRPKDKQAFKEAIMKRFNEILTEAKVPVHDIYLSEFVMQ